MKYGFDISQRWFFFLLSTLGFWLIDEMANSKKNVTRQNHPCHHRYGDKLVNRIRWAFKNLSEAFPASTQNWKSEKEDNSATYSIWENIWELYKNVHKIKNAPTPAPTHERTRARTNPRAHARKHARTHARALINPSIKSQLPDG